MSSCPTLPAIEFLRRMVRKNSGETPGLASAVVLRVGLAMAGPWDVPHGVQRFTIQSFLAGLHDPARLVAPGAVAQQAPVERADRQARQLGLEVDRVRTFWRAAGIQLTIGCARRSAYVLLFPSSTSAGNL